MLHKRKRVLELKSFPTTLSLIDYCTLIASEPTEIIKETDTLAFKQICTEYYIIPENHPPAGQLSVVAHGSSIRDVMNRLITQEVKNGTFTNWRQQNILSLGYRCKRWDSELEIKNNVGIECFFVNTLHSYFINPLWDTLVARIGEEIVQHILSRPVLRPSSNGTYLQIAGPPVASIIFNSSDKVKPFTYPSSEVATTIERGRCPLVLPRYRIFYNDKNTTPCLPRSHILNKTSTTSHTLAIHIFGKNYVHNSSQMEILSTLCESIIEGHRKCDIWRAFRAHCDPHVLKNTETGTGEESKITYKKVRRGCRGGKNRYQPSHWRKRAGCVASGSPTSSPQRGNNTGNVTVGERILQRSLYNGILDSTLASEGYISQDENVEASGLAGVAEQTVALSNEGEYDENCGWAHHLKMRTHLTELSEPTGRPGPVSIASCSARKQRLEPKTPADGSFHAIACPTASVSAFVKSVCRRIFPMKSVWGTRHNQNVFMSSIDAFICLGRSETMSLVQLVSRYHVKAMKWLRPTRTKAESDLTSAILRNSKPVDIHVDAKRVCYGLDASRSDPTLNEVDSFPQPHQPRRSKEIDDKLKWFVYWIFSEVIVPLVGGAFYVTEGEGTGSETLYYKKKDWMRLKKIGEDQMVKNFVKTSVPAHSSNRADSDLLAFPGVRFVPKKTSMRAITNMSKKLRAAGHCNRANIPGTLTNSALYNCMYVLRHICRQNPSCSGFGVDGVDDASRVLKDYKARVSRLDVDMTNRGYYVAILDLEKCFDSVDTAQLYDIVVELVSGKNCGRGTSCTDSATMDLESDEKSCLIHKYTVTHHITSAERFVARSIRHVTEGDDILSFQEASEELSQHYQDAVVTDGVVYSKLTREELLRVLRQHLFSHVVRMTSDTGEDILYNQVQGIPQGSVLSPLLCNIYYGRAECDVFGSENDARMLGLADGSSVIVRVVDDYIMVSLKRRCITYFLQRIYSCLGSYGGGVNMSKTRVNFDVSIEGHGERVVLSRADSDSMLWCGYDVNTKTLELSPSFSKIQNRPLEHTMNRECTQQGVALRKVMKSFLRPKLQPVILDAFMNSRETVVLSLYQLFSMTAKRAECYIRGKNKFCSISVARNPEFIVRCILEVVIYGANLVRRRSFRHRNRTLRLNSTYHEYKTKHSTNLCLPSTSGQCVVSKSEALWLGYQAFFDTLSKRRELYARVLDRLLRHLDSVRSNLPTSAVDEMKCSISKL